MKKVFFYVTFFITGICYTQTTETVYPITQELRESDWYLSQQKMWKQKTESNMKDGVAWINYYTATRCLRFLARQENLNSKDALNNECSEITKTVKSKMPNSFEANYLDYWNNGSMLDATSLKAAYQINPNDSRTYQDLMTHYYLNGNKSEFESFAEKICKKNVMSPIMLNWAYNVLVEVEKNAIVLTQGDADTYALLAVLNKAKRTDVTIINVTMYLSEAYQETILKQLGRSKIVLNDGISYFSPDYTILCLKNLFEGNRPVFIDCAQENSSLWNDSNPFASFSKDFYLFGLTYKYSKTAFDNIGIIRKNYEKHYLLDALSVAWSNHYTDSVARNQNSTYLPSMLKLCLHYEQCEENEKASELKKRITELGYLSIYDNEKASKK